MIQAAGVTANGLGRGLGLHVSDHGRIVVNSRLQAADHPDVFASDLAAVTQPPSGQPLPMLAPVAIQSGRHAGRQVARLISGEPLTDFRYRDKGGGGGAGPRRCRRRAAPDPGCSRPAPAAHPGAAGVAALAGRPHRLPDRFRNRLQVLIDWGWNYFTSRGAGAILLEQPPRRDPQTTVADLMPAPATPDAMSGRGTVRPTTGFSPSAAASSNRTPAVGGDRHDHAGPGRHP